MTYATYVAYSEGRGRRIIWAPGRRKHHAPGARIVRDTAPA